MLNKKKVMLNFFFKQQKPINFDLMIKSNHHKTNAIS